MRKIERPVNPEYLNCPIRNVIEKFGDKWSLLVLYHLHKNATAGEPAMRFNALHREMTDISQKMLSQTLHRMETIGLISRTLYPEVPPRVEYALTEMGQSLMPHIIALMDWSNEHLDRIAHAETAQE